MSDLQTNNFLYSLFGFERTRGKLNLFLVLCIHVLGWCFIFLVPLLFYPVRFDGNNFFLLELLSKSALIGLFYLNYFFLLPRFFEKKEYLQYFLLLVIIVATVIVWDIFLRYSLLPVNFQPAQTSFQPPLLLNDSVNNESQAVPFRSFPLMNRVLFPFPEKTIFGIPQRMLFITMNRVITSALILLLAGSLIRLGTSYIKNQHEKKALENANLSAEISLLKSQINPHFLFNTLNSIYALAHERSAKTEAAILKLSELLRYMLYESSDDKVELSNEIKYIRDYVELQRMRLSSKIKIECEVSGKTEGIFIAPFVLITFIENAFKHGVSYARPGSINININVFEKTLTLFVENSYLETDRFVPNRLGLKNVKRRLDLLYPEKHSLDIKENEARYIVNLKLDLSD